MSCGKKFLESLSESLVNLIKQNKFFYAKRLINFWNTSNALLNLQKLFDTKFSIWRRNFLIVEKFSIEN